VPYINIIFFPPFLLAEKMQCISYLAFIAKQAMAQTVGWMEHIMAALVLTGGKLDLDLVATPRHA